jgi:hypothetical protein
MLVDGNIIKQVVCNQMFKCKKFKFVLEFNITLIFQGLIVNNVYIKYYFQHIVLIKLNFSLKKFLHYKCIAPTVVSAIHSWQKRYLFDHNRALNWGSLCYVLLNLLCKFLTVHGLCYAFSESLTYKLVVLWLLQDLHI